MDFFENILRKSKKDDSIRVINIFTKPATAKGDNYTSDMYRVAIDISRKRGDQDVTEKKSLIVKVAPTGETMKKDLIEKTEIFDTEISMMGNTLKKMNDLLESEHRLNGKVFYVQKEHPAFLVIEDLATLGFRMANRQARLDLPHSILAIRGLARFHASSIAVCEKEPNQKKLYCKGMYSDLHPPEMMCFFTLALKSLAVEMRKLPDMASKYAEKIDKLVGCLYQKCAQVAKPHNDQFNVLNHGDFWVNNMMFRYNDEGKPIGHIFVDFQMCVYSSPALDLQYFLNTSLNEELWENGKDRILQEYHDTLTSTMAKLGCKTVPITMEDLRKSLKEKEILGMMCSLTILPLILVDKSEAPDLDECVNEDGIDNNPVYANELFHEVLRKRIPIYDQLGLLDL